MQVKIKKASKDYPEAGIAKGQTYYVWQFFREKRKYRSLVEPKRQQLTRNETLCNVYDVEDELQHVEIDNAVDNVKDYVSRLEETRDEEQEKFDELNEGFQQGPTGQAMSERVECIEAFINDLESWIGDNEDLFDDSYLETLRDELADEDKTEEELETELEERRIVALEEVRAFSSGL